MADQVNWLRVMRIAVVALAAGVLAGATMDPIGAMLVVAMGGGAVFAAVLLLADSFNGPARLAIDRFSGDSGDIINVSRVRVAGLGGLGLVIAAAGVALQFQLIGATVIAGIVGGAVMAMLMIVLRRPYHDAVA